MASIIQAIFYRYDNSYIECSETEGWLLWKTLSTWYIQGTLCSRPVDGWSNCCSWTGPWTSLEGPLGLQNKDKMSLVVPSIGANVYTCVSVDAYLKVQKGCSARDNRRFAHSRSGDGSALQVDVHLQDGVLHSQQPRKGRPCSIMAEDLLTAEEKALLDHQEHLIPVLRPKSLATSSMHVHWTRLMS